jgi:hypothetical protein
VTLRAFCDIAMTVRVTLFGLRVTVRVTLPGINGRIEDDTT